MDNIITVLNMGFLYIFYVCNVPYYDSRRALFQNALNAIKTEWQNIKFKDCVFEEELFINI